MPRPFVEMQPVRLVCSVAFCRNAATVWLQNSDLAAPLALDRDAMTELKRGGRISMCRDCADMATGANRVRRGA